MRVYSRTQSTQQADDVLEAPVRERSASVRHSVHVDRDAQAAREDMRPEFDAAMVLNPGSLVAPKQRPGFVQRWISDGSLEARDVSHYMKKMRAGWSPREPHTIPEAERRLYQTAKSTSGEDVIRVAGLVLCEMDIHTWRKREAALRDVSKHQLQSVPESLEELRKKGDSRVGPIKIESEEHAMRGRQESATMVD